MELGTKFTKVNGTKIAYWDVGRGEPLLLVHSWPTCKEIFCDVIPNPFQN